MQCELQGKAKEFRMIHTLYILQMENLQNFMLLAICQLGIS